MKVRCLQSIEVTLMLSCDHTSGNSQKGSQRFHKDIHGTVISATSFISLNPITVDI